jgi:hypothetical protein
MIFIKSHKQSSMVAHAYNPTYSEGRGRRILSLRPAWVEGNQTLSQKTTNQTNKKQQENKIVEDLSTNARP